MSRYYQRLWNKVAKELDLDVNELKHIARELHERGLIDYRTNTAPNIAGSASKMSRDKLTKLACYDTLTGLPNEFLFKDRLSYLISMSERENKSFAVMFVDLDHFKNVNDQYGHDGGDAVLQKVAAVLKKNIRANDMVARLHGDEFIIMLDNVHSLDEVTGVIADKIRAGVKSVHHNSKPANISASIGIAYYPGHGCEVQQLIRIADEAMYQAKRNGKDGTVVFTEKHAA